MFRRQRPDAGNDRRRKQYDRWELRPDMGQAQDKPWISAVFKEVTPNYLVAEMNNMVGCQEKPCRSFHLQGQCGNIRIFETVDNDHVYIGW